MCEYGYYYCPDGIVLCLIQMVCFFCVVNLLFLSICLFIWREYVCAHKCAATVDRLLSYASSGKREGGRERRG